MFLRLLLAVILLNVAFSIPFRDQIALLNSLQVGRDEEPITWGCNGCDQATKPIKSDVIEENSKDVKAILSVYEEYTVLSFRYTATFLNVIEDILFWFQTQDQHAPEGGKVQKEYDKMWNAVRDETIAELKKHTCTRHLIITGISLGGGLASLSYVDIEKTGMFDQIEVITFGSPRVGNEKWANWFNSKVLSRRYYIKNDPIAALPMCLTKLICNYKQVGLPIRCDKKIEVCENRPIQEEDNQLFSMELIEDFKQMVEEHIEAGHGDDDIQGLLDHINGYPKIKDYTYSEPN